MAVQEPLNQPHGSVDAGASCDAVARAWKELLPANGAHLWMTRIPSLRISTLQPPPSTRRQHHGAHHAFPLCERRRAYLIFRHMPSYAHRYLQRLLLISCLNAPTTVGVKRHVSWDMARHLAAAARRIWVRCTE